MRIGVIVGRFQTPELHSGHIGLVSHVRQISDKVLIFVGVARARGTQQNPLDYDSRRNMLLNSLPISLSTASAPASLCDYSVAPVLDQKSNELWSSRLDELIESYGYRGAVTLYGGRDSFIPKYSGKHKTVDLTDIVGASSSSTELRKAIDKPLATRDFRAGVIFSVQQSYRSVFQCVDIALVNSKSRLVLLGRKANELEWRFPGGFVDNTDASLEAAAARELKEETGISVSPDDLKYVCSTLCKDWRYRDTAEKNMTVLYEVETHTSVSAAADDLEDVRWISMDAPVSLVETHIPLWENLISRHRK